MEIRNVTREALDFALDSANEHFDGNLRFKVCELKRKSRDGGEVWRVSLTVRARGEREQCDVCGDTSREAHHGKRACEYNAKGYAGRNEHASACPDHRYRRGQNVAGVSRKGGYGRSERYIAAACWHAHGVFFDALPPVLDGRAVTIVSALGKYSPADELWRDGYGGRNPNVGSAFYPMLASECCDCEYVPAKARIRTYEAIPERFVREACETVKPLAL